MAKYRRKPYFIEVVPYEEGMEDAYLAEGDYGPEIMTKAEKELPEWECYEIIEPMIDDDEKGYLKVKIGDYIATNEEGKRKVISKEELERDYEFICK